MILWTCSTTTTSLECRALDIISGGLVPEVLPGREAGAGGARERPGLQAGDEAAEHGLAGGPPLQPAQQQHQQQWGLHTGDPLL